MSLQASRDPRSFDQIIEKDQAMKRLLADKICMHTGQGTSRLCTEQKGCKILLCIQIYKHGWLI